MTFPLTKDEWYMRRDDRTKRVDGASGFEGFSIGVTVSPIVKTSFSTQVMTITTLNMLARWCRKIVINMPDVTPNFPGLHCASLRDKLKQDLLAIDPFGQFDFREINAQELSQTLLIGASEQAIPEASNCLWIDGANWVAGIGSGKDVQTIEMDGTLNPTGPAFASCLGVAELFRQAMGLPASLTKPVWYSMYDYTKVSNPKDAKTGVFMPDFDFGRIHQVGCGAVGSSLDFLLSLTDWKANLDLIDYDKVEISNCNRSLTFSAYDAVTNTNKVDACANVLKGNINALKFNGSYGDFVNTGKFVDSPPDLILCLANEQNIWSTIQNNIPPLTFHATTTPNWAINFGRHIPKKEWCILCRFSQEVQHQFKPVCAEGEIKPASKGYDTIMGVLPFLSTTAAVLILAEMAKLPLPKYPMNKDFVEFSTHIIGSDFQQLQMQADEGCDCNKQPLLPHLIKSKFWDLSC